MVDQRRRQRQARLLRRTRRLHRWTGLTLFVFFLVVGLTSVLLGWKKNSDTLQPPTQRGSTTELSEWLPLAELRARAQDANPGTISRMDVRPERGIVKVLFAEGHREVQLDGATGALLSRGVRHADWIEALHDGSIVSQPFKLVYSTLLGLALLIFSVSGFWLWYGPKRMRKRR